MKTKKREMYFIPMDVDIGSNKNALKPTITSNIIADVKYFVQFVQLLSLNCPTIIITWIK